MEVSHMFFSLFKKIILLWLVLPFLHLLLFASSIMGHMDLMHVLSAYHRCNMCYVNIPIVYDTSILHTRGLLVSMGSLRFFIYIFRYS